jgi:superfamily II DNA or RNA helicase
MDKTNAAKNKKMDLSNLRLIADKKITPVIEHYIKAGNTLENTLKILNPDDQAKKESITRIYNEVYDKLYPPSANANYTLRDYQLSAANHVLTQWQTQNTVSNKSFIELPTGAGKTLVMYHIINEYIRTYSDSKPACILILCPRIKLCEQHVDPEKNLKLLTPNGPFSGYEPAIINSKENKDIGSMVSRYKAGKPIIISATYQSIARVKHRLSLGKIEPTLVFADEAHLISSWQTDPKSINNPNIQWFFSFPKMVFMTATPTQMQKTIPAKWGTYIREVTIADLIQQGHLSEIVSLIPNIRCDAEGKMSKKHLCQVMHQSILRHKRKKAIVFCNTQNRCIELYREFESINKQTHRKIKPFIYIGKQLPGELPEYGPMTEEEAQQDIVDSITAELMAETRLPTTDTESEIDPEAIEAYEKYSTGPAILFVCRKVSMGYDHAAIDFVAFADPKCSKADLSQSIGRGLRTCKDKGKDKCYIFIPITPDDYEYDTMRKGQFKTIFEYIQYLKTDAGYEIEDTLPRVKISTVTAEEQQPITNGDGPSVDTVTQDFNTMAVKDITNTDEESNVEYINPEQTAIILQQESVYREGVLTYKVFVKTLKSLNLTTPEKYNNYVVQNPVIATYWPGISFDIYEKWSGFRWIDTCSVEEQAKYYLTGAECKEQIKKINELLMCDDDYEFWTHEITYKKMRELDPKIPETNYELYYH